MVLNLQAMSAQVIAVGRVGEDSEGEKLLSLLNHRGVNTSGIVTQQGYPTSIKTRYIAQGQQLLRVDREEKSQLTNELQEQCLVKVQQELPHIDIVAISDYEKGFFTPEFLAEVIRLASAEGKKVIVDPKGLDFAKYRGAFLIKPNEKEALLASPTEYHEDFQQLASWLCQYTESEHLLITRSSKGMSLLSRDQELRHFPIHFNEVVDVTGAGDTVLSMLVVALASDLTLKEAVELANRAAGESIKHIGCYAPTLGQLKALPEKALV